MSVNASAASLRSGRRRAALGSSTRSGARAVHRVGHVVIPIGEGGFALMDRGSLLPRVQARPTAYLPD